ncbi:pyruvate dehydrogenase E1 component subunit alpha, somatic form, mitochondrial-like [Anoplophora glabripennis]|uniref:pyruvate dehydrogenase E1 component subunit alpha, somatic form, mitochondrial-like n=1 Tax=Anoplophora glabripennis TaxID=217634 RepID=UPI0008739058|nr:pyruvate dehydrogenase E1 component subunit alpha, somatic form, mitochondrial-like [Anoplophora glabripennis]
MSGILSFSTRINNKTINRAIRVSKCGKRFLCAKFESSPYDLYKLDAGPATSTELTKEDALKFFRSMNLIRKMEREISVLYSKKIVRGFCHLYSGQEAVCVGTRSLMIPTDTAITSYRCHAWMMSMGNSIQSIIAEVAGVKSGCSKGKGGSMHMFGPNIYGGAAIVGAHVPLGTGLALAHKYKGDGGVCITIYGDGATDQGQVFEAMNQAKLLSLPVLYLIENNIYSMGTPLSRHSANQDLYTRGDAVPGIRMDGMDILSVREGVKFCLEYIRGGNGPIVLELLTYRYFGHSLSDPGTSYRSRDEIKQVREMKDPIMLLKNKILSSNLATEEELNEVDKATKVEVEKTVKTAVGDKPLDNEELGYDIYCNYKGAIRMPGYGKFIQHKNTATFGSCK